MRKLYYAYVMKDMTNKFEEAMKRKSGDVKIVSDRPCISEDGEELVYYVLEAEEGTIGSEWELK